MSLSILFELRNEDYEPRTRMIVEHKGEVVMDHSDGGEPEDNTFGRDWNWVPGAIEKAYRLGFADGKES